MSINKYVDEGNNNIDVKEPKTFIMTHDYHLLENSAVADHNIIALGVSAIFGPSEATRTCLGSIFSYSALISRTCVWTASFQQMLSISLKTL